MCGREVAGRGAGTIFPSFTPQPRLYPVSFQLRKDNAQHRLVEDGDGGSDKGWGPVSYTPRGPE